MSKPAILVENLSKRYKIGLRERLRNRTFGEAVVDAIKSPLRRMRHLGEKSHGDDVFWALKDVSFEVQPGEVIGIIGRNGAGKSTLLKILSRITEPTEGRAVIRGHIGSLLEVGTGFHPELTGRENVYLNGAILGMKKREIDRQFDEIVAFAEVEKFLDTPVKHYSSGMYVRLAFAVAAHLNPEILIVDEVLAVGDASFQKKCLGKMQDVASGGRTVLFVSHNMEAVQKLCQRVALLANGQLVNFGPTPTIIGQYWNAIDTVMRSEPRIRADSPFRKIALSVNGEASKGMVVWDTSTPLDLDIDIASPTPFRCPEVDIAFFRFDDLKLFGLYGAHVLATDPSVLNHAWRIHFQIPPLHIAAKQIYFDIGARAFPHGEYSIHWQRACEIMLKFDAIGQSLSEDSFLLPKITASYSALPSSGDPLPDH
jgi:lipopolysaccharide transport system ATP-binding protein